MLHHFISVISPQIPGFDFYVGYQIKIKLICRLTKSAKRDLFLIRLYLGKVWRKLWIILEKNSKERNIRTEIYQKFTSIRRCKNTTKFLQINIRSII